MVVRVQPAVGDEVGVDDGVDEEGVDAVVEVGVHVVVGPVFFSLLLVSEVYSTYSDFVLYIQAERNGCMYVSDVLGMLCRRIHVQVRYLLIGTDVCVYMERIDSSSSKRRVCLYSTIHTYGAPQSWAVLTILSGIRGGTGSRAASGASGLGSLMGPWW